MREGFSRFLIFFHDVRTNIELLSVISEKDLLENSEQGGKPPLPELKFGELILLASLDHQAQLAELLAQQGLQKNQHWVLFS